jgi:two-component system, NarL family, response regulator LiaR
MMHFVNPDRGMTQMNDNSIRVLVVDDHPMVRRGLMALVRTAEGMVFAGEASNGQEAIQLCRELRPTVVLMDLVMPVMDGAEATRHIRQHCADTQVLVLTSFHEMNLVQQAINAGAVGYLLKTASSDELIAAIRSAGRRVGRTQPARTRNPWPARPGPDQHRNQRAAVHQRADGEISCHEYS